MRSRSQPDSGDRNVRGDRARPLFRSFEENYRRDLTRRFEKRNHSLTGAVDPPQVRPAPRFIPATPRIALLGFCMTLTMPQCWAAAAELAEQLETCVAQAASAQANVTEVRAMVLVQSCPEAARLLNDHAVSQNLGIDPADPMYPQEVETLAQLARFLDRDPIPLPSQRLKLTTLEAVLAETSRPVESAPTWWQRLKQWLKEWFGDSEDAQSGWLRDWLDRLSLPSWVGVLLRYVFGILIVVLAAVLIAREVGRFRRRGGRANRVNPGASIPVTSPIPSTWQAHEAGAPARRAGLLLMQIWSDLMTAGRIERDWSRTNRQFIASAQRSGLQPHHALDEIVQRVESVVYGGQHIEHGDVDGMAERARAAGLITATKPAGS